ncbi:MAG: hypothetical protein AAFO75_01730 [Pseudomonadota bacterium]
MPQSSVMARVFAAAVVTLSILLLAALSVLAQTHMLLEGALNFLSFDGTPPLDANGSEFPVTSSDADATPPRNGSAMVATLMLVPMGVHYWTIRRPDVIGPLIVLSIGVIADVLTGTTLGLTSTMALATYGVAHTYVWLSGGTAGRLSAIGAWGAFCISAFGCCVILGLVYGIQIATSDGVPLGSLINGFTIAVCLYPIVASALRVIRWLL